jgi:hypothetical protein
MAEHCAPVATQEGSNLYWVEIRALVLRWKKTVDKDGDYIEK